tara:strand:+ start:689 stop:934 length:246 start_codon:yes stop_codon:yes gene_type:complete
LHIFSPITRRFRDRVRAASSPALTMAHLDGTRARKDAKMRTSLILIQAGFLIAMAVIGAADVEQASCPLPAPVAQHCEVPR